MNSFCIWSKDPDYTKGRNKYIEMPGPYEKSACQYSFDASPYHDPARLLSD
jgi:hypothetical protein